MTGLTVARAVIGWFGVGIYAIYGPLYPCLVPIFRSCPRLRPIHLAKQSIAFNYLTRMEYRVLAKPDSKSPQRGCGSLIEKPRKWPISNNSGAILAKLTYRNGRIESVAAATVGVFDRK